MGVERAVTCWYIQRQVRLDEIAHLEKLLAAEPTQAIESPGSSGSAPSEVEELEKRLKQAREQLRSLGLCPRPMMG